ncbi:hypothetical protein AB0I28_10405 [Phytomonospora sp. NPDC050363]|uniref:hypothetical protein n=1 Tax=Phytomonospora sp. NPDC050363 TaxID=3155642 RepID=UPI0033E9EEFB
MTAVISDRGHRVRRLRGLWPTYQGILLGNLWYLGFWAVLIVVYTGIALGIWLWGSTDISLWETSTNSTKGTMAAVGVMLAPAFLPILVAAGLTRRSFVAAASAALATLAAGSSLLVALGFVVERWIYAANEIPGTLQNEHLYDDTSQLHLVFVESLLLQLAYAVSGALIGLCFYRFGAFRGILLILPCSVLAASTEALITGGTWFGPEVGAALGAGWPSWALIVVPAAAIAVGLLIVRALAIGAAVRPRKT